MNPEFWTDFADGAIMFPIGVAVPLILALMGQRRAALAWIAAIGSVWAVMLILKLTGYTTAALFPASPFSALHLVTPSGHVASSASIYGGLTGLLLSRPGTVIRRSILAAILVAVIIGITRVSLGDHSVAEVIVGGVVGVAGAAGLAVLAGTPPARRARLPIVAAALLIIVIFHGHHTTWEETIRDTATWITQHRAAERTGPDPLRRYDQAWPA